MQFKKHPDSQFAEPEHHKDFIAYGDEAVYRSIRPEESTQGQQQGNI